MTGLRQVRRHTAWRRVRTFLCTALTTAGLAGTLPVAARAQEVQGNGNSGTFTLKVENDLVLTNVVVRDKKTGQPVRGLSAKDFSISENGKAQSIVSFDFEDIDKAAPLNEATVSGTAGQLVLGKGDPGASSAERLRDHRLVILFFDLTSMQPEDLTRSVEAARTFVQRQMSPADLVAAVSLDTSLSVDQDFTAERAKLLAALNGYSGTQGQGYAAGATSTTNQTEDASSFTPDESEYNDINTDRELFAIASISKSLAQINQKKSLLYFSGGIQRDGMENQASLRSAVNAAVRSNLSIYSVDTRGLQAVTPLGDASTGSLRGTAAYTGAAMQNNLDANFNTQEVMSTLATDTGGRFYGDSNDFAPAFTRMEQDSSAYYVLGFRSTNPQRDGSYRRLTVKVNHPGLDAKTIRLDYRPGYYAPADYQHSNHEDRERQLEEQLRSDLPATDISVYLAAYYFRTSGAGGPARFTVPVSLIVPGSQLPQGKNGDRGKATLDIIAEVKDTQGHPIGDVRDTVKLPFAALNDAAAETAAARKNVQYSTRFALPSGHYRLKFVVRENETGRMGSFEAEIALPDLTKAPVKLSSVVLSSQRAPAPKQSARQGDPLVQDGLLWIPNVPHVFRAGQHLFLLYEVYDPATHAQSPGVQPAALSSGNAAPRVLTSIEFLSGPTKVYETPMAEATKITNAGNDAIAFQFDVPLTSLKPGLYTCQVNVIDDNAGAFTFPRLALLVR